MSEFVDLYDRNRKFLNRVVDRNTYLFQPGEFMMYVLAILENEEGKFLVTQRALDKKWAAGGWEMPGMRLCVLHNLYFYNHLMEDIRGAIDAGNYKSFKDERLYLLKTYDKK